MPSHRHSRSRPMPARLPVPRLAAAVAVACLGAVLGAHGLDERGARASGPSGESKSAVEASSANASADFTREQMSSSNTTHERTTRAARRSFLEPNATAASPAAPAAAASAASSEELRSSSVEAGQGEGLGHEASSSAASAASASSSAQLGQELGQEVGQASGGRDGSLAELCEKEAQDTGSTEGATKKSAEERVKKLKDCMNKLKAYAETAKQKQGDWEKHNADYAAHMRQTRIWLASVARSVTKLQTAWQRQINKFKDLQGIQTPGALLEHSLAQEGAEEGTEDAEGAARHDAASSLEESSQRRITPDGLTIAKPLLLPAEAISSGAHSSHHSLASSLHPWRNRHFGVIKPSS